MHKYFLIIVLWVFAISIALAQKPADLLKARQLMEKGQIKEALALLNNTLKLNPNDPEMLNLLGKAYLKAHNYKLANLYLAKAVEKSASPGDALYFDLAEGLHLGHQFTDAIEQYENADAKGKRKVLIQKRIDQCKLGKELLADPKEVKISNMGSQINSELSEYHPLVSADEVQLFFTRSTHESSKMLEATENAVYQSFNKSGWEKAIPLPSPVTTDRGEAVSGISPDGQTLYIIRPEKGGDIYISDFKDGKWSKPKPFPYNSPKAETSVSISADGKRLFFVSNRTGNMDIFSCTRVGANWSKPVRLGGTVNSSEDEESPWLDAEGKYLYFSSRGHSGMGGFDIFRVPFQAPVTEPENLGFPINSASDDLFFMLLPDGKQAFYSSGRDGGMGGQDLYRIMFGVEKPKSLSLLKGTISEATGQPIDATVTITDLETRQVVAKIKAHPETGTFVTMLQEGKSYSVLFEKEGFLFYSDLVNLSDPNLLQDLNREIRMQRLQPGVVLVLNNIFFDHGKSSLRKESTQELQRILIILRQNPGMRVEISSHLEADGPEDVSQKITENRAQAIVDYLVATGIKSNRMVAKGYGSTKPLPEAKAEKNKWMNRRTELRVIGM